MPERCKFCGTAIVNGRGAHHSASCPLVTGEIVTTDKEDRGFKACRCCACGDINICTPSFDFYTTEDHGGGLVCESCFKKYAGRKMTMTDGRGENVC
jgi:hypothetical protein